MLSVANALNSPRHTLTKSERLFRAGYETGVLDRSRSIHTDLSGDNPVWADGYRLGHETKDLEMTDYSAWE